MLHQLISLLDLWIQHRDLPGTEYFVERSYTDKDTVIVLRWLVFKKAGDRESLIYGTEESVACNDVPAFLCKMENGELKKGLEYHLLARR